MKNSLETRLGIFVALAVIAAVLILEIVGGVERFERGYELKALFNTVQDLKESDRVKMAGVEVGRVSSISLDETNNKVLVVMKLREGVKVRTDSVATVKFTGLMGQNFVSLDFGTRNAPIATPGTMLATQEQPDLSAVMAKIDNVATGVENLTKSFTGDKIDNLLGPFTDFLKANRVPLTATIANLQAVSSQIAQGKGTVGKLIYDDTLYNSAYTAVTNLQETATQINLTVADARKVVDQVNAGQGTVGKLLHDDTLYRETTDSMTNLKEILQKINQGQGSVGKLVNDQDLYKNAKLTLQKLDQATEGLEDQGPLSILGSALSKLF
ncbi:MAG TPA: MlaD family protein [Verrucomicrobiae bacterium]|nr:MlaD family protein [Verrucomicrobiae bacterium]